MMDRHHWERESLRRRNAFQINIYPHQATLSLRPHLPFSNYLYDNSLTHWFDQISTVSGRATAQTEEATASQHTPSETIQVRLQREMREMLATHQAVSSNWGVSPLKWLKWPQAPTLSAVAVWAPISSPTMRPFVSCWTEQGFAQKLPGTLLEVTGSW